MTKGIDSQGQLGEEVDFRVIQPQPTSTSLGLTRLEPEPRHEILDDSRREAPNLLGTDVIHTYLALHSIDLHNPVLDHPIVRKGQ